tara:strand:- start:44026 stop:44580 length:555 start_codon:yes stop_codon:yes gene_type:complete
MKLTFTLTKPQAKVTLQARKTMNGEIMIYDHPDFDVVVSPNKSKVLAFSKEQYGPHIYAAQSRLFDYLSKNGVVDPSTVHAGNVFGSLEGVILEVEQKQQESVDSTQVTIYSIAKFFENEKGLYAGIDKFEDELEKELSDPPDDETTELGKVPHRPRQGSANKWPGGASAYGLVGYYLEEKKRS